MVVALDRCKINVCLDSKTQLIVMFIFVQLYFAAPLVFKSSVIGFDGVLRDE